MLKSTDQYSPLCLVDLQFIVPVLNINNPALATVCTEESTESLWEDFCSLSSVLKWRVCTAFRGNTNGILLSSCGGTSVAFSWHPFLVNSSVLYAAWRHHNNWADYCIDYSSYYGSSPMWWVRWMSCFVLKEKKANGQYCIMAFDFCKITNLITEIMLLLDQNL